MHVTKKNRKETADVKNGEKDGNWLEVSDFSQMNGTGYGESYFIISPLARPLLFLCSGFQSLLRFYVHFIYVTVNLSLLISLALL